MSTTVVAPLSPAVETRPVPTVGSLLLAGSAAAVGAAVATALVAAAASAAGVGLDVAGAPIPASGFAVMTMLFSAVGLIIAAVLRRVPARPRVAWIRVTVVLTMLSFVPDVLADAAVVTKLLLILTHVVAAGIVIPAVARRLA